MNKKLIVFTLFLTLIFFNALSVEAKLLPRAKPKTSSSTKTQGSSASKSGVNTSVKFRGDRRAIVASFSNLNNASSVSYTLMYNSRGTTQGAGGSITNTLENTTSRELIFGTCSHGVCRYDSGITDAKFVVTVKDKSGRKYIKTFKLKP